MFWFLDGLSWFLLRKYLVLIVIYCLDLADETDTFLITEYLKDSTVPMKSGCLNEICVYA